MNIKEALKKNGITQEEFANYLGKTREGLNKTINHGKSNQSIIDSLKVFVSKKRGIEFNISL